MNEAVIQECVEKLHEIFERTDLEVESRKIEQKLREARYNPGDVRPLADCILSILVAARSRGYNVTSVLQTVGTIAREHLDRRWKKMPDGTYQAV
ncbi:MAG: hypothetical protein JW951_03510 [Lentisphaerae bacterium]|nr:hypothetical protein [Lentisphaerota bacterium]